MAEECTHDCSTCSADCGSRQTAIEKEKQNEGSNVRRVIGIVSGKGGVGKSLVTSALATVLRRRDLVTAILDADVTGPSIPKAFGLRPGTVKGCEGGMLPPRSKTGIEIMSLNLLVNDETEPVVWRGPVIAGAVKQFWTDVVWGDVDYMFVDMPPGTGDVPLTVFQSLPVDGIVVVSSPQELVSMIVEKAIRMAEMMKIPVLGLIENYSYVKCPDCGKEIRVFGESKIEETAKRLGVPLLARIPLDPELARLADNGQIELLASDAFDAAADEIERALPPKNE
ncbi:MAG: Mrp/NBP35 family ATP-binding protein [Clostridia bacterium]|nr:Mrp/NBP35 family ATP-binding protein [Clostridia bacterium]